MSEYGEILEPKTVRLERTLPGPIERVWAYLTDSQERGTWLASGEMQLRRGGRVELDWKHSDLSPVQEPVPERFADLEGGHHMEGRITEIDPPRKLGFTWGEDASEVTFELTPRGEDVLLVITHRRLSGREEMISVASGWHAHLAILADNLEGKTPRPFWSTHAALEGEYEKRFPHS